MPSPENKIGLHRNLNPVERQRETVGEEDLEKSEGRAKERRG